MIPLFFRTAVCMPTLTRTNFLKILGLKKYIYKC